jgi:hypothetical protein
MGILIVILTLLIFNITAYRDNKDYYLDSWRYKTPSSGALYLMHLLSIIAILIANSLYK